MIGLFKHALEHSATYNFYFISVPLTLAKRHTALLVQRERVIRAKFFLVRDRLIFYTNVKL